MHPEPKLSGSQAEWGTCGGRPSLHRQMFALRARQDDPKAGFAGDHLLEGFIGSFQRVALDHGTHAGERVELNGVFG